MRKIIAFIALLLLFVGCMKSESKPQIGKLELAAKGYKVAIILANGFKDVEYTKTREVLEKAGVKRAKVIIGCMTDVCNAFALLAAKDLNPNIYTIAVLRNPDAETKLRRVGVDLILSPYRDVAKKVFAMLMRPATIEFIETIMGRRGDSFMLEKIVLEKGELIGKTLKEIDLRKRVGCMVVAIARNGELLLPDPNIKLERGDVLFVIGKEESLRKLDELI